AGHPLTLVGPGAAGGGAGAAVTLDADGLARVPAAMTASLPIYPGMSWAVPALPPLMSWLAAHADLVQLATPGPMGLVGLVAARSLGLPVLAQYHTEVADYAARLTGLPMVGAIVAPIVGWMYQQADLCLAPSAAVADRLRALGVAPARIERVQRGVDLARFRPERRDRAALARHGVDDGPIVLYVGRLSREKNLEALVAAWPRVVEQHPRAQLVLAGEGPLAGRLAGPRVRATGPLHGDELAAAFASADVFAFPSETETFGNAVVEAAASGLPAVVARGGAAHEHVVDGETGVIVDGADRGALAEAIAALVGDPIRARRMGRAARLHARRYDQAEATEATCAIYRAVAAGRGLAVAPPLREVAP
ncbi:MAG TPA: glycosyltransferase, partial [Kofleriaceae bacterium]|nr:glycosyltransferase [Kofleriaceae bacterium]